MWSVRGPGGALRAAAALAAAAGCALGAFALFTDRAWFERHVLLPHYLLPRPGMVGAARVGAALAAAAAALVALALHRRARAVRAPARTGAGAPVAAASRRPGSLVATLAPMGLALAGAVVVAELVLRATTPTATERRRQHCVARGGVADPRLGWSGRPSSVAVLRDRAGVFTYATNAWGARARSPTDGPHPERPALVVVGESNAAGEGLEWDDTFAARAGRALDLEVTIAAEAAYAPDQAYLRLMDLLPRLARPAAVVTVFAPIQMGRALASDRPRLALDGAGALEFLPPEGGLLARLRLADLFRQRLPYLGEGARARSVALVRAVFAATAAAARARGARPLFIVVSPGAWNPAAAPPGPLPPVDAHARALDDLARAVLGGADAATDLPYRVVDLDPTQIVPGDGHPNAAGAARIADVIVAALTARAPGW